MTLTGHGASAPSARPVGGKPSPADLGFLQGLVRDRASIEIGANRDSLWASRLSPLMKDHGVSDLGALVRTLRVGDRVLENAVIDAMTTNETSFFRDGATFSDISSEVIPRLLANLPSESPLTIWFAACSSGQEVYSLAMSLAIERPELIRSGRVRLLATDISKSMVERCRQGRYSGLEVRRGLDDARLKRFFDPQSDSSWIVRSQLRDLVLTRQLNLVESLAPVPTVDLVLIRNVLIYFSDEDKLNVLRNIARTVLHPGGALILGASEMLGEAAQYYTAEDLPNSVCYRPRS